MQAANGFIGNVVRVEARRTERLQPLRGRIKKQKKKRLKMNKKENVSHFC